MHVKNTFLAAAAATALSVALSPSFAQTTRSEVKAGAVAATHAASGPAGAGQGIATPSTAKPMKPSSVESRTEVKSGAVAATHSASGPAGTGEVMGTQGRKPNMAKGSDESRPAVKADAAAAARQPGGPSGSGTAKKREQDRPMPAASAPMKP